MTDQTPHSDSDETYITEEQARELAGVAGAIGEFADIAVNLTHTERKLQKSIDELRAELPTLLPRTEALVERRRLAVWLVIAGILTTFLAVNLVDHHIEHCGPANRPDTKNEKTWCDWTFFMHDHPTEQQSNRELVDELLRDLGHDPEKIREQIRSTSTTGTTTTLPPATPPATSARRTATTVRRTTTTARRTTVTTRAPAPPPTAPPTTDCERLPNGKCKNEGGK